MGTNHGRKERDVPGSDVLRQRRTPQLFTPAARKWRRRRAGRDSAVHSRRVQPRRAGFLSAFAKDRRPGFIARPSVLLTHCAARVARSSWASLWILQLILLTAGRIRSTPLM